MKSNQVELNAQTA